MEATSSSKTLATSYNTMWRHNPERHNLHADINKNQQGLELVQNINRLMT
jgi:hypothetical protein